jgi:hypothetical protein
MGSERRGYAPWVPGRRDIAQVDERTLAEAEFERGCAGLSDDEAFARAYRASEVERLIAELGRAAAVAGGAEATGEWSAAVIACLNLMGIETLLPGEEPVAAAVLEPGAARIHLRCDAADGGAPDQLDALSGLICDFQRTSGFVNGLLLVQTHADGGPTEWSIEARHPGIAAAFGDFVMDKYVVEAWRLG